MFKFFTVIFGILVIGASLVAIRQYQDKGSIDMKFTDGGIVIAGRVTLVHGDDIIELDSNTIPWMYVNEDYAVIIEEE